MVGASALTGMGFTVPLLFARVAFSGRPHLFAAAQAGLLAGSVASAVLGAGVLLLLGALGRKAAQNPG
jgi:Na+/H+ antiporter NhaA